ncbi:MAG: hypothetical protein KUG70_14700 [Rhodobacteraceae bacterium]|nr:hypothetical protein [Paracoccaceae bacterium]
MTELRDGFIYHQGGDSPTVQLKRFIAGEFNPEWDNVFSTTIAEADDALAAAEKEQADVTEHLRNLNAEIERLKARKVHIKEAVQHFEDTGEIDDVLIPRGDKLLAAEQQAFANEHRPEKDAEIAKAEKAVAEKLGVDWDLEGSSADDEFVYITVKQRRANVPPERPSRQKLVDAVMKAFEGYSRDFKNLVIPRQAALPPVGKQGPPR